MYLYFDWTLFRFQMLEDHKTGYYIIIYTITLDSCIYEPSSPIFILAPVPILDFSN